MNLVTADKIVDEYFVFMKNWDNDQKKNLIIKLTSSIDTKLKEHTNLSSLFGAWSDNRSADEIINELRSDRVNKESIEEF